MNTINIARRLCSIGKYITWAGILFWFLETWYFGWNLTANSNAERWCDRIAVFTVAVGVSLYIDGLRIYRKIVEAPVGDPSKTTEIIFDDIIDAGSDPDLLDQEEKI